MNRFWDQAAVVAVGAEWSVVLDGKPMRLPDGGDLRLPWPALADAIAEEWRLAGGVRGGKFSLDDLPLTRLAATARERIAPNPLPVVTELARYAETDLLCYRADTPEELVRRQDHLWQPWLDWAERDFAAPLAVTRGVMPVTQESASVASLARALGALDAYALAAMGVAVPALGSVVLGLAMARGKLDAATADALAALDEDFQQEFWGADVAAVARRKRVRADVALAGRMLALVPPAVPSPPVHP
jgi:chaperone required for assembly of F1-ATPase